MLIIVVFVESKENAFYVQGTFNASVLSWIS